MTNYSKPIDTFFHALSDPTRRAIVETLSNGPASVGDLAKPYSMALPSFMQHIRILEDGGMIKTQKVGRVRQCTLEAQSIDMIETWTRDRKALWGKRLDGLERYLEGEQKN